MRPFLSKLHENGAALVGRRAENRILWNRANLRVDFPCTNIFGLALMAGEGEVLLTGGLLRPTYVNGQRLFALLAHRRKVIIWHRDQSLFSGGSEFYARRHIEHRTPKVTWYCGENDLNEPLAHINRVGTTCNAMLRVVPTGFYNPLLGQFDVNHRARTLNSLGAC